MMALNKSSRVILYLLICVVVLMAVTAISSDDNQEANKYEEAKGRTEEAKNKVGDTAHEAKEASESWTEWAKDKITEGLGFKHDEDAKDKVRQASESAYDTTKSTKDNIQDTASG